MKTPDPRRFSFKDMPVSLKKQNPFIHNRIFDYDDLPHNQKEILSKIKKIIQEQIGECQIRLFGSRINGNWIETSDYDLLIYKSINKEAIIELKSINFGVRVDLCFTSSLVPNNNYILI